MKRGPGDGPEPYRRHRKVGRSPYSGGMYSNRAEPNRAVFLQRLAQLEQLIALPPEQQCVKTAGALTMYLARNAPNGRVANLAMQAMSGFLAEQRDARVRARLAAVVSQLRAQVENA